MEVLIAEDDLDICELLSLYLSGEGYSVTVVNDGLSALNIINKKKFDIAIFDIMMPKLDGFQLIKKVREEEELPIIILSAKDHEYDKILGLNIGADDYITKPFNPLEVLARVNAHLRRTNREKTKYTNNVKKYKKILLNTETCRVFKDEEEVTLTATEYKILNLFLTNPSRIYSKMQIAENVSPDYYEGSEHTIVVHISNLRNKLGNNEFGKPYIKTIKGLGYKFDE